MPIDIRQRFDRYPTGIGKIHLAIAPPVDTSNMFKLLSRWIKKIVGGPGVPPELTRMYVAFMRGSLSKPNKIQTREFAKFYPVEYQKIINGIMNLTDMGPDSKKKPTDYIIPISASDPG